MCIQSLTRQVDVELHTMNVSNQVNTVTPVIQYKEDKAGFVKFQQRAILGPSV